MITTPFDPPRKIAGCGIPWNPRTSQILR